MFLSVSFLNVLYIFTEEYRLEGIVSTVGTFLQHSKVEQCLSTILLEQKERSFRH